MSEQSIEKRGENKNKRFEEKKMAADAVQRDYSSIMKFLIMLASACIGFSATLIHQHANVGIAWAMCLWGACLVLIISALVYSIWAQMKNINLLADHRIEYAEIYRKQPPNWPQDAMIVFSFICFIVGIMIFIAAVWPEGKYSSSHDRYRLHERNHIHDTSCHCFWSHTRYKHRHGTYYVCPECPRTFYNGFNVFRECESCR